MNVRIGKGRLVHSNPPRCKRTYLGQRHPTTKRVTCPGCQKKAS